MLTQKLGVKKVFCVIGFSMGAQQVNVSTESNNGFAEALQAYYWSVMYPDFLERYVFDGCASYTYSNRGQDTSPFVDQLELALTINGTFRHLTCVFVLIQPQLPRRS